MLSRNGWTSTEQLRTLFDGEDESTGNTGLIDYRFIFDVLEEYNPDLSSPQHRQDIQKRIMSHGDKKRITFEEFCALYFSLSARPELENLMVEIAKVRAPPYVTRKGPTLQSGHPPCQIYIHTAVC
jgi:hypothetical protein